MTDKVLGFLKDHTSIRNKAVLIVYLFVIFFKFDVTIFQFSVIRFLKEGIGDNFLVIGTLFALSNVVVMLLDIPLGVMQKYIKPRTFFIYAVSLLLASNLIFVFAELSIWLAFIAVFLYQISIEIFFVTITTYIFRLSTEKDFAQNMAQEDIADNIGDVIGSGLAGILLVLDRLFLAHNALLGLVLAGAIGLTFFFIYEFIDKKHFSFLEKYIFNLKSVQAIGQTTDKLGRQIIQSDEEAPGASDNEEGHDISIFKLPYREIFSKLSETFTNLMNIVIRKSEGGALLLWIAVIVVVTSFWSEVMNDFQPVFVKSIYSESTGWVASNIPRYFYESFAFIAALIIPTFFLELPIGKLADLWGKEKMIILGVLLSAFSIFFLGIFSSLRFIFILLILLSCGFVITYPSMVAFFNEQYQKIYGHKTPVPSSSTDRTVTQTVDDSSDGDGAGIIAIVMNIGQISGAFIGGLLLNILPYQLIFIIFGIGLMSIGIWSKFHLNISFRSDTKKSV